MDEQFDKKLTNRIREVFDNYEAPGADAGWARLRQKFPEKQERKIAWLWWGSAAAILLVFLGFGLWLFNKPAKETIAVKPATKQQPAHDTLLNLNPQNNIAKGAAKQNAPANALSPTGNNVVSAGSPTKQIFHRPDFLGQQQSPANTQAAPFNQKPVEVNKVVALAQKSPADRPSINPADSTGTMAVNSSPAQQVATVTPPSNTVTADKPASVVTKQPAKSMDDIFKSDQQVIAKNQTRDDKKELKRVNFSVYAATYINYAEGSANQVNAGAGVTSDIRLSKNIKLSTGVMLAQNSLKYGSSLPPTNDRRVAADRASAAPDIKQESLFSTVSSVAELQNYDATLVGLDIPLNIKFEFNPDKSDAYLSAGISSGTFVDERYTTRYAYRATGFTGTTVTTQDQTTQQSFNSFYFAKTINLAFGIGTAIGRNRLVIEPFLKYPIGGMGQQDLRFGSGGLNLKFNFKPAKK